MSVNTNLAKPIHFIYIAAIVAAVSILLFEVVINGSDVRQLLNQHIRLKVFPWIPLAILFYIMGFIVRGLRLRWLVSAESQLPLLTATNVVFIGHAANNFLPLRLGEIVQGIMLASRTGLPIVQSMTVVIVERLFDGISIVILLLLSALFLPLGEGLLRSWETVALITGCGFLVVFTAVAVPNFWIDLTSSVSYRIAPNVYNKSLIILSEILRGLSFLGNARRLLSVFLISISIWGIEAGFFAMMMPCVGLPIQPSISTAVMSFTNIGIVMPARPAYDDTYHFYIMNSLQALFLAKTHFVVDQKISFSYALLVHMIFYGTTTSWGFIAFASYLLRLESTVFMQWQAKPIAIPEVSKSAELIASVPFPAERIAPQASTFFRALIESLLGEHAMNLTGTKKDQILANVTDFVLANIAALPKSLRYLLNIGLSAFQFFVLLATFGTFDSLEQSKRIKILKLWSDGPISLTRKLFRPVRSLALLAFYEDEDVKIALHLAASQKFEVLEERPV